MSILVLIQVFDKLPRVFVQKLRNYTVDGNPKRESGFLLAGTTNSVGGLIGIF
jgi:hypothetical protein